MSHKPIFNYTVRCQSCGWYTPAEGSVLTRTAMDEELSYHRRTCPGRPLIDSFPDDAA